MFWGYFLNIHAYARNIDDIVIKVLFLHIFCIFKPFWINKKAYFCIFSDFFAFQDKITTIKVILLSSTTILLFEGQGHVNKVKVTWLRSKSRGQGLVTVITLNNSSSQKDAICSITPPPLKVTWPKFKVTWPFPRSRDLYLKQGHVTVNLVTWSDKGGRLITKDENPTGFTN